MLVTPAGGGVLRRPPGVVFAAVVAVLSSCVTGGSNPFERANPTFDESAVWIFVENRGFREVRLTVLAGSEADELGAVESGRHGNFAVEITRPEPLRFRLDTPDGRTYTTADLRVSPGDRVEVIVPDDPRYTRIRRR